MSLAHDTRTSLGDGQDCPSYGVTAPTIRIRAPLGNLTEADLYTPDIVFQIGLSPRRIDLLTSIANVEFDEAWADSRLTTVSGIHFPVLGRAMFLKKKRSTGRAQDLADAEWLEENPESPIDGEAQTRR